MTANVLDVINQIVVARTEEIGRSGSPTDSAADIAEVIQAIRTSYHRDWDKQKLEFAREFLSRTLAGMPLPVLSVCGHGTQEIRYSTYLAYFLDGGKPHGLGNRYLDAVLTFLDESDVDTYRCVVETERWLGQVPGKTRPVSCFCDIVVTCAEHVIFIENKIKSSESSNPGSEASQLRRYDAAIRGNPEFETRKQIRVFLTPTGRVSSKSPNWVGLSYRDLVTIGTGVLRAGGLSTSARENLKRLLMDISLGPFDKAESEIQELTELAAKATTSTDFANRLRFDQGVSRNSALVELLMEG